jgi:Holliday junction resolvasome RuvABC endonuclease subunit
VKKIIGLDISSSVIGFSIIEFDKDNIELKSYGNINPPKSKKGKELSLAYRGLQASKEVKKLLEKESPDFVAIENYASKFSSGRSTANTIIVLSFFNELMSVACIDSLNKEPVKYPVLKIRSTISKHLKIKSVSKEDMFDVIKNHFSNFSTRTNRAGNIGKECFDQADAIAVAFCHAILNQK